MRWLKTIFMMIIFIFVILFSIQNKEEISLRFGLFPLRNEVVELPKLPLFFIILCSIFIGILIGGVSDFYRRYQLKRTVRQNIKTIERLSQEVESLRRVSSDQPSFLRKD